MTKGIVIENAEHISRRLRSVADVAGIIEKRSKGAICQTMRISATDHLTRHGAVDTGLLRNSVMSESCEFSERDDTTVSVGIKTDVHYAMFIEYGTGPLGDPEVPHTDKMQWVYPAPEGGFKTAHSQPARPFMRPALYDNRDAFVEIIAKDIQDVYEESK